MIPDNLRPHFPSLILLVMVTFAVYGRTLGHDFLINWDDNVYVSANSSIYGFSVENIRAAFTNFYAGNYAPLQMLSYMLDYTFWGLWPGGFLLTNVVLHTLNGILLYAIVFKSYGERVLAAVAAAIFLLHPVQVESVAWISQRKNLLAMFFMLIAWLAYFCCRECTVAARRCAYLVSLGAFLCSLLSKSATVFFPFALLFYDYWFSAAKQKVRLNDKIPFLLLAAVAALLAMQSQSPDVSGFSGIDFGGRVPWHGGTPWATFLTMMPVFCSYLKMLVWPLELSALYSPVVYKSLELPVIAACLLLFTIGYCFCRLYRTNLRTAYWASFSILAILPVSQLVPLVTLMNDRYLYFPLLGVAVLGGIGAVKLRDRYGVTISRGLVALLLVGLASVSFQRAGVWKNSRTLWSDAVNKVPGKFDAWEGLGEGYHLTEPVSLKEAEYAYSRAFAIYSSGSNNLFNLARVKLAQGDEARALTLLQRLLTLNPGHVMGWAALGDIYLGRQSYNDAFLAYKRAEQLQPEAVEVNVRLCRLASQISNMALANFYYERIKALGGDVSALRP